MEKWEVYKNLATFIFVKKKERKVSKNLQKCAISFKAEEKGERHVSTLGKKRKRTDTLL